MSTAFIASKFRSNAYARRAEPVPFVDATVLLGLHDSHNLRRLQSVGFFASRLSLAVRVNSEQMRLWKSTVDNATVTAGMARQRYEEFVDALTRAVHLLCDDTTPQETELVRYRPEFHHLRADQALVAGQVLQCGGLLATHDPALLGLTCLRSHIWHFPLGAPHLSLPPELEALYQASRGPDAFVYVQARETSHE